MPTTIRTSDVREVLALVPFQLGFRPTESAVLISLRGARSRVGLVVRVDLADIAADADNGWTARTLVGHVVADGARRAVAVLYTAADLQSAVGGSLPQAARERTARVAARVLADAAADSLGELETWVVGPRGYYALGCTDPGCCPPGGRPLDELQGTRIGAQMVLDGQLVAPTREDLVRLPDTSAEARKAARRARARWAARGAAAGPGAQAHRWRRDGLALWRSTLADVLEASGGAGGSQRLPAVFGGSVPGVPAPTGTGRLLAALDDVLVRDAVLLTFVEGNERIADRLVAGETGPAIGQGIAAITDPVRGRHPDLRRVAGARAVLEHVAAHATRGRHAPALTLLAVLAWWEGDGARSGVLVDRALDADPEYRLAVLVDEALRTGMPPGWVRASRAG
ncbi:DUF4192 domain-containing protein [Actinotalea fermentans]|nr:DUF4192 domain-containing protein [Actinotalea fermentans]